MITKKSNILFCGDPHGQFKHIQRAIDQEKPSAVILLGDMEPPQPLHELLTGAPIYFIPGNHDGESVLHASNIFESAYAGNNLHNRVVEIDGIRIAGLGGVFSESVWMPPANPVAENLDQWHSQNQWSGQYFAQQKELHRHGSIFLDDYLNLMTMKADILVVHDAPSCHPYGFEAIDDLARELGVHTVYHGDHHDSLDYSADEPLMGFRTYGVGLRGITDQNGNKIRAGELDDDRFEARMKKKADRDQFFGRPMANRMRM
ncbi:metallophosphoesterase [Methylobacillus sp. Pita2]|uniref:metallophosphoesterase family protein n=1 Tax=Methylobacillus sp. Pita2 TaxID=3383245 RepID=UPI0038B5704C